MRTAQPDPSVAVPVVSRRRFSRSLAAAGASLLVACLVVYAGLCLYLYMRQGVFIFLPEAEVRRTPATFGCTFEEVWLEEADRGGDRVHGWWLENPGSPVTFLYFHGNRGNVGHNAEQACRLRGFGFSVFLFDYRGFGRSSALQPSETSLYGDADRAWDYVVQERGRLPGNTVLYGHSLGGAVAVEMAVRHPDAAALIVESSFTSMLDMALGDPRFDVFPINWLLTERFDSLAKMSGLEIPVLLIHGTSDRRVLPSMSEHLYAAAREPKSLLLVRGARHANVARVGGATYATAIHEFLAPHTGSTVRAAERPARGSTGTGRTSVGAAAQ